MKYNYKLTQGEGAGCGLRLAGQRLAQRSMVIRGILLVILGVAVLNAAVSASAGGRGAGRGLWIGGTVAAGVGLLLFLGTWIFQTRQVLRRYGQEERTLTLKDGLLTVSSSREVFRYRCREIGSVKQRGNVYWIEVTRVTDSSGGVSGCAASGETASGGAASGQTASGRVLPGSRRWLFLPLRVLGGSEGQALFLQTLEEQRKLPGDIPDFLWIKELVRGAGVDSSQNTVPNGAEGQAETGTPAWTATGADILYQTQTAAQNTDGAAQNTDKASQNPDRNADYHNLASGFGICQERDFPQMLMVTAQWDWIRKRYLTGWKKRRYLYLPAEAGVALLLFLALGGRLGLGNSRGILLGMAAYCYLRLFRSWQNCKPIPLPYLRGQLVGLWPESYRGRFQLTIEPAGVWRRNCGEEHFWTWEELGWLLESENHYFLCTRKETLAASFDKELLGPWMSRKLFVQDCQRMGLCWEVITPQVTGSISEMPPRRSDKDGKHSSRRKQQDVASVWRNMPQEKEEGNGRIIFTFCAVAALVAAVFLLPEYGGRGGGYEFYPQLEGEGGKRARAEDYPDYLPLDQQAEVLGQLGFQVPEEDVEALQKSMEEQEESRVWIEGYPYHALLSSLGAPEWDEETWEVTRYSDQAFWFDWEAFSLEGSYQDILSSINAMSGGSCQISEIQMDTSEVDWESGSGRIAIRYQVNGTPQECTVSVQNDWLDPVFLEYVNRGLKAAGVTERIYAMDDGGQGCILFFRDKEWAKEFQKKTGMELE